MTCAGLDLHRHSLVSPPINDVFLDGRLWLRCTQRSANLAPVKKRHKSLLFKGIDKTSRSPHGGDDFACVRGTLGVCEGDAGALRAVSLTVPRALVGSCRPRTLHRLVTLSERCTAERRLLRHYHVFHQIRFISHALAEHAR